MRLHFVLTLAAVVVDVGLSGCIPCDYCTRATDERADGAPAQGPAGGGTNDAGGAFTDAANASDGGFCTTITGAFRCFDFDTPSTTSCGGLMTNGSSKPSTSIVEVQPSLLAVSPPQVLFTSVPAGLALTQAYCWLEMNQRPTRIELQLRLVKSSAHGQLFRIRHGGGTVGVKFIGTPELTLFTADANGQNARNVGATFLPNGNQWMHLRFDLPSATTVLFRVDGGKITGATVSDDWSSVRLDLGPAEIDTTTSAWEVLYDNFVVYQ